MTLLDFYPGRFLKNSEMAAQIFNIVSIVYSIGLLSAMVCYFLWVELLYKADKPESFGLYMAATIRISVQSWYGVYLFIHSCIILKKSKKK